MKPLGILLIAYIAGLVYFFVSDYFKKEAKRKEEMNNNEKVGE